MELGVRHDGGDGRTGTGVEVGAGVRYVDPAAGVTVSGGAHTLLLRDDYGEWGVEGLMRMEPGRGGRGWSVRVRPGSGAVAVAGVRVWDEALKALRPAPGDEAGGGAGTLGGAGTRDGAGVRLQARVGYGLVVPGVRGVLTPYGEWEAADSARSVRLGTQWKVGPASDLTLGAERREVAGGGADDALRLEGRVRF